MSAKDNRTWKIVKEFIRKIYGTKWIPRITLRSWHHRNCAIESFDRHLAKPVEFQCLRDNSIGVQDHKERKGHTKPTKAVIKTL